MELILFLILGGWLLLRIGADKSASNQAQRDFETDWADEQAWRNRVTNPELERELKLFIERPENNSKLLDEVKECYDSILVGKRIDELFPREYWCKPDKGWTPEHHERVQEILCRYSKRNALRIMLAKRGYISDSDAMDRKRLYLVTISKLDHEVLWWCDKELRKFDAPLSLERCEEGGLVWCRK